MTFPAQYATIFLDTRAYLTVSTKFCPALQADFARSDLPAGVCGYSSLLNRSYHFNHTRSDEECQFLS